MGEAEIPQPLVRDPRRLGAGAQAIIYNIGGAVEVNAARRFAARHVADPALLVQVELAALDAVCVQEEAGILVDDGVSGLQQCRVAEQGGL